MSHVSADCCSFPSACHEPCSHAHGRAWGREQHSRRRFLWVPSTFPKWGAAYPWGENEAFLKHKKSAISSFTTKLSFLLLDSPLQFHITHPQSHSPRTLKSPATAAMELGHNLQPWVWPAHPKHIQPSSPPPGLPHLPSGIAPVGAWAAHKYLTTCKKVADLWSPFTDEEIEVHRVSASFPRPHRQCTMGEVMATGCSAYQNGVLTEYLSH